MEDPSPGKAFQSKFNKISRGLVAIYLDILIHVLPQNNHCSLSYLQKLK